MGDDAVAVEIDTAAQRERLVLTAAHEVEFAVALVLAQADPLNSTGAERGGDGAAVGLRPETEAVLGRPRGAAHAAAARGARPAHRGNAGERRVPELERRVTRGARPAHRGNAGESSGERRVPELTTASG